ncbi:MAG: helix-turn-helix transcriptional regulator [Actinobacteria bacterium]|nr:helix-turn-helix transcriptional regulator [Actinomycetota bacterium]
MVALSEYGVAVHLDELLEARGMTLAQLAEEADITVVNLSVLKNGRAKAVRFSTLAALCRALDCQPGDLLSWTPPRK